MPHGHLTTRRQVIISVEILKDSSLKIKEAYLNQFFLEISALRNLCHHPYIVTLIANYSDEDESSSLSLVLPYRPLDLVDIIERARNTTNPSSPLLLTTHYEIPAPILRAPEGSWPFL